LTSVDAVPVIGTDHLRVAGTGRALDAQAGPRRCREMSYL
jgi:hypothetical protein